MIKKISSQKYNIATNFAIILFFFAFQFLLSPKEIFAAPYGLSITPPLLRVQIKPGKAITQVFTIQNLSPDDKFFVARIVPFTESDNLGNPIINLKEQAGWQKYFTLSNSFIKLDEPFSLAGGASNQLILSITIPDSASLQDLYATLLVSTYTNAVDASYQGSVVNATIGSNLLITICSELNPSTLLKIENFIPTSGTFIKIGSLYIADNLSPLTFSASVKNDGSFTTESKGIFKVTTDKDNPVLLDGILPVYVISKNSRDLLNTQGGVFSYTPTLSQIGMYKVSLEIKSDNANAGSSLNIVFIPLKALVGLLFSLIIIGTIIRVTQKPKKQIDFDK